MVYFHTAHGLELMRRFGQLPSMMVQPADIEVIIQRWKNARRALMKRYQPYADRLIAMLEEHKNSDLRRFDDPLEAAAYIVLIGILKEQERS